MPNHYVEDYEQVMGKKPAAAEDVEAKVITTEDEKPAPKKSTAAKTKSSGGR